MNTGASFTMFKIQQTIFLKQFSDAQEFYGIDQKGNNIQLQITLRKHHIAQISINLRLNGCIYKLPSMFIQNIF